MYVSVCVCPTGVEHYCDGIYGCYSHKAKLFE